MNTETKQMSADFCIQCGSTKHCDCDPAKSRYIEISKENHMETKHTPGPWIVGRTITGSEEMAEFVGLNSEGEKRFNAMVIAPSYAIAGVGGVGREECLANARLIASAPDMAAELATLRADKAELVDQLKHAVSEFDIATDQECKEMLTKARRLITKHSKSTT